MTVTLYNCTSAANVLHKSYSVVQNNITATAKGAIDVDRPALILDYNSLNFNYFHISEFGRYYNVTSRSLIPGNHILLTGESDPLESFAAEIANLDVLAVRAEDLSLRTADYADGMIPLESDMQIDKVTGDAVIGSGNGYIVLGVV
jgi:hypothetical protein